MAPVGDVDAQDGCGVVPRDVRPHTDALENAPRAVGQGDGALVEARLSVAVEGDRFDDRYPQARRAEGAAQARPHHAAADHEDVERRFTPSRGCVVFPG